MFFVKIAVVKSLIKIGGEGGVNEFVFILFTHMPSDVGEVQYKSSVAVEQE
jgi:hypothetical protein